MANRDDDQRLLTLVGCIRGIVLEFDGDARYLNAWADDPALLAAPREAMVGKTINEVLGSAAGAPFTTMVHRVFLTGEIEHLEYPLDIDGCRRWFFADIKRVGTPPTVVFFARDITERRATEEQLARSDERYRLAAQATNDVLWDWDLATDQVMWNAAKQSLLGYDQEPTPATWWKERLHPDDRAQVFTSIGAALAGDASAWSARYRFRRADGSYGSFLDRGFITRDARGRSMRMVGSMTDVTQVDRLQAQLLHADRMVALGTLAAGVGHEINNPLSYVIGNLDVVLATIEGDEALQEPLREARDGALRIAEIVKSLRMFARADDHELGAVEVHDVLDAAIKMADHELRRRAKLVRDYGSSLPPVHANDAQLGQVFLNLLINAAQSIGENDPDGNEIRISTAIDDRNRVTITIRDTGCGISPEQLGRVFDPFFTTKPVGNGTGLGLSICHGIVQKLGGEIAVTSEPGKGSAFMVTLPVMKTTVATLPRLLVIDDELRICRLIVRMLHKHADVVIVNNARDGLDQLRREHFDLVLCDVMMPDMTGIDLYDELQRTNPSLLRRVYFMTGGAYTPRAGGFLDAIGPARLDKPLQRAQLLALLSSVCNKPSWRNRAARLPTQAVPQLHE